MGLWEIRTIGNSTKLWESARIMRKSEGLWEPCGMVGKKKNCWRERELWT